MYGIPRGKLVARGTNEKSPWVVDAEKRRATDQLNLPPNLPPRRQRVPLLTLAPQYVGRILAWTIEYTATARKQLCSLDRQTARHIVDCM